MPRPLECVSQLQRQFEEELNSVAPWQYKEMIDRWCEAQHFVDVRDITFGDHEVFHADFTHTHLDGGSV